MKHRIALIVSLGLSVVASAVSAAEEGDTSVSVGLNMFTYEETGFESAKPMGLDFSYLHWNSPHVAYEFRAGFSISDDSVADPGFGIASEINLDVTNYFGAYVRYAFRPDKAFNPYGILGYSSISAEASAGPVTVSSSGGDVSYGLGFDYMFNETFGLNMEYLSMYSDTDVDLSSINVGIVYSF